jgi:hypothetical protein
MNINQYIDQVKKELDDPSVTKQRKRHLKDELILLNSYQSNHPSTEDLPNSLELFCDMNPHAPECKRYEL